MAKDFVHSAAVVDAVIAALTGADGSSHTNGLPAEFWTGAHALRLLEHGDLADYVEDDWDATLLPGIIVRSTGTELYQELSSTDGGQGTVERIRVVHIRRLDQCLTDAGAAETNMSRARERYAKLIGKALFADPVRVLGVIATSGTRTNPTLTCADTHGAAVKVVRFVRWDLGNGQGGAEEVAFVRNIGAAARVWAIACDLDVYCLSGP